MRNTFVGALRETGAHARFKPIKPHADRLQAALRPDHPALIEARTLFPSTVVSAERAPRLLVEGKNSSKLGDRIRVGPWKGLAMFTLTLEERASCPTSCGNWDTCFGNSMPQARRHVHGAALEARLAVEVRHLLSLRKHREGIAVRLHILGDFYDRRYVEVWLALLRDHPKLRVWGYTAHPADSEIGALALLAHDFFPARWVVRTSVAPEISAAPMQVTTIWRQPETPKVPEGTICLVEREAAADCVSCGLCWAPNATDTRIVFVGHGMRKISGPRQPAAPPNNPAARMIDAAGGAAAIAVGMGYGQQAIERYRATGHVPEKERERLERLCSDLTSRRSY